MSPLVPQTPRRRRRPLKVALVVVGALLLLLLLLLALAPVLGSSLGAGYAEGWFAERYHGKLEVGELDLAWSGRQTLRDVHLLDPEGLEVAVATVELPGLWALARGGGKRVGRVDIRASADLVADESGTTNLDRALAPREEARAKADDKPGEDEGDWREPLRELDLEVHLQVERLSWSDTRTRALGGAFVVQGLEGELVARPGEPLSVRAKGAVLPPGAAPGSLELDASIDGLTRTEGPPPGVQLRAGVENFPTGLVDSLAGQEGMLVAFLGPTFSLRADGSGTLDDGNLALQCAGEHARLEGDLRMRAGVLTGGETTALRLRMEPPPAALTRLVGDAEGSPRVTRSSEPLELRVEHLELPVAPFLEAQPGQDALPQVLAGLQLTLQGDLHAWTVTLPVEGAGTRSFAVRDLALNARVAPVEQRARAELDLRGELGGDAAGSLRMHVEARDLALIAAAPAQADGLRLELLLAGLPAGLIDALGGGEPLAQRALGDTLDVQARAEGGMERGSVELDVRSRAGGSDVMLARARARLEDGVLVGEPEGALQVRWTPGPGAGELLAGFLPADARAVPPREAVIEVRELRVPLRALSEAPPETDALALMLEQGDLVLHVALAGLAYEDAKLKAAGQTLELPTLTLAARRAPDAGPHALKLELQGDLGPGGRLAGEVTLRDAASVAKLAETKVLPATSFSLRADPLAVDLLAAYASGPEGAKTLRERLGDSVKLIVDGEVEQKAGSPLRAHAQLDLEARGQGTRIALMASLPQGGEASARDLPAGELSLEAKGLATLYAFAPASMLPLLVEALGDEVLLNVQSTPAKLGTTLGLHFKGRALDMSLAGTVVERVLELRARDGFSLQLQPSDALLAGLLGAKLPPGTGLSIQKPGDALVLQGEHLRLPLDAWWSSPGTPPAALPSVVQRTRASFALTLPALEFRQAAENGAPLKVDLHDLRAEVALEEGGPLRAHVQGIVAGDRSGKLDLNLEMRTPAQLVESGVALPHMRVTSVAEGLPTALIDALAGQDGLLVDVLGPAVDARVSGSVGADAEEPLKADLRSRTTKVELDASASQRVLRAAEGQGIEASLPLTPLFNKRIVGALVPVLLQLTKPEDEPIALRVHDFVLPLNGDLTQLDASIDLDLGTVGYQLLPGLQAALQLTGTSTEARTTRMEPLKIRIDDGVARYERLPIPVGGETLVFKGSYNLAKSTFDLTANVPLALMGSKVERELERVREFLPPDTVVPLELRGRWSSPKISIGKQFLDTVVREAAEGALKRGLGELFDRRKKKD